MTARRIGGLAAAVALLLAACAGGGGGDATDDTGDAASATGGGAASAVPAGDDDTAGDADVAAIEATEGPVDLTLPPDTTPQPVAGGTMRFALEADVDGLNPTTSSLSVPGLTMASAVFDTLSATSTAGEAVPYLAESFTPSDDLRSWTVKLRPGITFHDGTPLNADAVLTSFELQRQAPLVGLAVKPAFPEQGAATKIDDLTVQFNLLDPTLYFPTYVAGQLGMVASPTWLAAAAEDPTLNQQPVGTGPFMFDSRTEDSVTRFVRNDAWWNGDVYLDAVEFYPVPDPDAATDLLLGGDVDGLHLTNPASIARLAEADGVQNVLNDAGEESFAILNTSVPPFDDLRARQALAYATPIDQVDALIALGTLRRATHRFIPESPFYDPSLTQVGDDPDRAAALAAEYCAERGDDVNTVLGGPTCTDGRINVQYQYAGPSVIAARLGDLLTSGWSAAFNVTITEVFQDDLIENAALGRYNVNSWRQFGAEDPAADNIWLQCRTIGAISLNWPRYCDEERDALLLQAQAEGDPAARAQLYQRVETITNEAFTYVFWHHVMWDNAFAADVRGVCGRTSPEGVALQCTSNGRSWFDTVWLEQ